MKDGGDAMKPGDKVKIVDDTTNHEIPVGSEVIILQRHPEHSDAWVVEGFNSFVRDCEIEEVEKCSCGGEFEFQGYCGARVCASCSNHKGLARCYCGWTASGSGDGRHELEEMGEIIEPDGY